MYGRRINLGHRMVSLATVLIILSISLIPSNAVRFAANPQVPPVTPQDIPAPPTGGPRPTISLNPNHGYFEQSVVVSGQGVTPYPGVRVAWLTGDATLTAAVLSPSFTLAHLGFNLE